MIEKFGHVAGMSVLYAQARIGAADVMTAVPDVLLGALFVIAFVKTGGSESH
jgi:hypothetical protein